MSAPRRSHTPEEIGQEPLAGRPTPKKNRASWQRGLRKVLSVRLFGARVQRGVGRLRRPQKATGLLKHRPSRQARPALPSGCDALRHILLGIIWRTEGGRFAASLHRVAPIPRTASSAYHQKGEMVAETDPTQWPSRKARYLQSKAQ